VILLRDLGEALSILCSGEIPRRSVEQYQKTAWSLPDNRPVFNFAENHLINSPSVTTGELSFSAKQIPVICPGALRKIPVYVR
jgi:hypothetical protein